MTQRTWKFKTVQITLCLVGFSLLGACGETVKLSMAPDTSGQRATDNNDPMDPNNFDNDDASEQVAVTSSLNKHCIMGVRHMYNEDWALAEKAFRAALSDNATELHAMFGLAVALEKQRKWREAFKLYKEANLIHPRNEYTEGWKRVETHFNNG